MAVLGGGPHGLWSGDGEAEQLGVRVREQKARNSPGRQGGDGAGELTGLRDFKLLECAPLSCQASLIKLTCRDKIIKNSKVLTVGPF